MSLFCNQRMGVGHVNATLKLLSLCVLETVKMYNNNSTVDGNAVSNWAICQWFLKNVRDIQCYGTDHKPLM